MVNIEFDIVVGVLDGGTFNVNGIVGVVVVVGVGVDDFITIGGDIDVILAVVILFDVMPKWN